MDTVELERIETEALASARAAGDAGDLRAVERHYLGKGGVVAELLATIPDLAPERRKDVGQGANRIKRALLEALEARADELAEAALEAERAAEGFDPTLPAASFPAGTLHPVTRVQREVEAIFESMGYRVLDGPEVELERYNFVGLNIPADHPARDAQDTIWLDGADDLVLRSHTSPVQVRALETMELPLRVVVPGRVFRQEATDATHEHTFHQVEGLVVGEGIHVGHLIGAMKTFLRLLFGRELDVRLRPGYFPFVEPGFELEARCPFCERGCSVCKQTTWIEMCGCGMVHPNVLTFAGHDPERWTGFAFGFGLSRLVMLRYGIDDVRHLLAGDVRFLEQFPC